MASLPRLDGPSLVPQGKAHSLVVLLHGYGSNGEDMAGLAAEWAPDFPHTAFLCPNAPDACEGWSAGYQWFPIRGVEAGVTQAALDRKDHILRPASILSAFLDAQLAHFGLDDSRLAVGGFSQGAMMALYAMPRRARPCAGILGYSGLLVDAEGLKGEGIARMPVFLVHGTEDSVVPPACLAHARAGFAEAGFEVAAHLRPRLAHGIDGFGLAEGAKFLRRVFSASD